MAAQTEPPNQLDPAQLAWEMSAAALDEQTEGRFCKLPWGNNGAPPARAFLMISGLLIIFHKTLDLGRLSGTRREGTISRDGTLEPPTRGTRFLGISTNWHGLALMILGALLLLIGPII